MESFQTLAAELAITIGNDEAWLSIGLALLLGGSCLVFGIWVTQMVGLLNADAPAGETLGVGLAAGLMVLAAWWAAIWSGGRSSFTPVAVGLAIAIVVALAGRVRRRASTAVDTAPATEARRLPLRSLTSTALAGGAFVVAIALLYGSTMARSPRSPDYDPIPVNPLQAIEQLPADAKLAYACQTFEEISFVNSKLLGIDAHTGRRVVPMCFQADVNGPLLGAPLSTQIPNAGFAFAPQAALYPDSTARPTSAAVAAFLRAHAIEYIYADAGHPNVLVNDAVPVATSAGFEVLRLP